MIPFEGVAAWSSKTPGPPKGDRVPWQRELRAALSLALVPVSVGLALGLLLLPRQGAPDSVPLPTPDARELERTDEVDRGLAEGARREPLPAAVRALGSAIRDYHVQEARGTQEHRIAESRQAIEAARGDAIAAGDDALLRL